jgi:hypothetical protein
MLPDPDEFCGSCVSPLCRHVRFGGFTPTSESPGRKTRVAFGVSVDLGRFRCLESDSGSAYRGSNPCVAVRTHIANVRPREPER